MNRTSGAHPRWISTRLAAVAASAVIVGTALTACTSDAPLGDTALATTGTMTHAELSGQFVGAGASTQQSAMEAWIALFQEQHVAASVIYDPNGSGAGRTQFLSGGALWAGTDAVLTEAELETATLRCGPRGAIDLPVYISPIAITFNLEGIETLNLSPEVIASIFTAGITRWNDPAIAVDNPGVQLPDLAITPVHRTDNSGTTANFAEYLSVTAPEIWVWEPTGTWPLSGGESAQGTSGVVNVVNSTPGAITYADFSQVGVLGTANILVAGNWVPISAEAAAAAIEASPQTGGGSEYGLAIAIDRDPTTPGVYPLVLVSYVVACLHYDDPQEALFITEFLGWIASADGQELAAQVAGSAPISAATRDRIARSLAAITFG